jgi:LysM repeat protein
VDRTRVTRWAAPVAFLAAITIGALVVRAGFEHGRHSGTPPTTTVSQKSKTTQGHGRQSHEHPRVRRYTIQTGDTLASIAEKTGTTVDAIEKLNPGIDPTALRVGEKIRVQ